MIPVSEMFYTLQGEGAYVGYPAIFVRVGGCNLSCAGFGPNGCDSNFSVDAKKYRRKWKTYTTQELIEEVSKLIPNYPESKSKPIIVLTGGEPTIYIEQLKDLVTYFISRDFKVQFETNATQMIAFDKYPTLKQASFAMSVKLSVSGEPEHKRVNIEAINNILANAEISFFKFVCANVEDVTEAATLLKEIPQYATVYIMPLGETKLELEQNSQVIFEEVMKYGFSFSDRLHIRIYNDERGK